MKRYIKILLIILGSIFALILILTLLAGPIAKSYIEDHGKELCNRTIKIEKLYINLFRGVVSIKGFDLKEEDDTTTFFSFEELKINTSIPRLLGKEIRLTKILLIHPKANIIQTNQRFNFTDIIEHFDDGDTTKESESAPWKFDLRKITLDNGTFIYRDVVHQSVVNLEAFSLNIPRVFFSNENTDISLKLKFGNGGDLALKMLYAIEKNQYKLNTTIKNLDLSIVEPYIKEMINISHFEGILTSNLTINGSLDHIMEMTIDGDMNLRNVRIDDPQKEQIAAFKSLTLDIDTLDLTHDKYYLKSLIIDKLDINYDLYQNYNTLSRLTASSTASPDTIEKEPQVIDVDTTKAESKNETTDFRINHIAINNSHINYTDHTLTGSTCKIPIKDINITVEQFSFNESFPIHLKAIVGDGGVVSAYWKMALNSSANQTLTVDLKNVQLKNFSPYCVHYTAFPLKEGILNFSSKNVITNNLLTSENNLSIYKCKVENKMQSIEPEFHIPLKAALYILTDRKGKISIDLPITGDISSPKFSFKSLIIKTFVNLIIKVSTSPVNFIVNAINDSKSIFSDMNIPLDNIEFSQENLLQLNQISDVLKEKNKITLTIAPSYDKTQYIQEITELNDTVYSPQFEEIQSRIRNICLQYFATQGISNSRIQFMPFEQNKLKKETINITFGLKVDEE